MVQRFKAHRFIEQFATWRFRCTGIFTRDVSGISGVFECFLKNQCAVNAG
jgi:hypothetical protein